MNDSNAWDEQLGAYKQKGRSLKLSGAWNFSKTLRKEG